MANKSHPNLLSRIFHSSYVYINITQINTIEIVPSDVGDVGSRAAVDGITVQRRAFASSEGKVGREHSNEE